MSHANSNRAVWLTLIFAATLPRLLGAFLLPNAFGDAYVYIRDIGVMSVKIKSGSFALTDLYGFWLPLYQFLSAILNVFVGNGFYAGKLVSAVFGVGVCLLVYAITVQLVAQRTAALLAFGLITFNPLHIVYSASAMTDVPHAFFVLASLLFCIERRWVPAAIFASLAGLTRMESWMFLAIIPAVQIFRERVSTLPYGRVSARARRFSPGPFLILLVPPVFWIYLSWKATGSWSSNFVERRQYLTWLLDANPALAHFSWASILRDSGTLLVSTDLAVLIGFFVAVWIVTKGLLRGEGGEIFSRIVPALVVFVAFFSLIVVAYLSGTQPIIFPRYGLILFSVGIPVLVWAFMTIKQRGSRWTRRVLIGIVTICVLNASVQFVGAVGFVKATRAQRVVADYLRDHLGARSDSRIFSDEGTVTVMSGIPAEKFLTTSDAPKERESFLAFLNKRNVEYAVYTNKGDSTLTKLFPELENGAGNELFQPVLVSKARFFRIEIWVYQVRNR